MAKNPLISIIIPVYNAEKYIEKCLSSLLAQTYSNIEILCTNDCSTDNSASIIQEMQKKDSRIKLFQHKTNKGPATARNTGLDNASGEYIMFCDNDDSYKPNMCEKMLNTILEQDVDLVTCRANIENTYLDKPLADYVNSQPIGRYHLCDKMKCHLNVLLWNKIYKKSLIDKYEIRFPDGVSGEDDAFCCNYGAVAETYYGLEDKLYDYVLRKSSFTFTIGRGKASEKRFDKIRIIEFIYNFMEKYDLHKKCKMQFQDRVNKEMIYMFEWNKSFFARREIIKRYNTFIAKTIFKEEKKSIGALTILKRLKQCYWF